MSQCVCITRLSKKRSAAEANSFSDDEDSSFISNRRVVLGELRNCAAIENPKRRRPLPNYVEKVQKDVSAYMRGVLVDWLVKVAEEYKLCSETLYAEEYKLCSETLYLSISYIDRYLSLNTIARKRLQLLGVKQLSDKLARFVKEAVAENNMPAGGIAKVE
ncbi:hypothetical protein G4B88_017108 [Cannabis sativa]|uniref:B-like cyclin n=1 Tax=Cannabis sativa TaxID=3483 RepID=A0A7J6HTW3_CANSA|nr:hypothetical protein G4B88_017108 [Cannabis sativa]